MKIFYICYEDLNIHAGWTTHIIEAVNNLVSLGHDVTVFAPQTDNNDFNEKVEKVFIKKYRIRWIKEYLYYFQLYFDMLKSAQEECPSVIYVREMGLDLAPYFIARKLKIPLVVEINGLVSEELKQNGTGFFKLWYVVLCRKLNLKFADKVVAVTSELARHLEVKYPSSSERMVVIDNGVNIENFTVEADKQAIRKRLNLPPDSYLLIYIGSFYPHHGLFDTIKLFEKVVMREPKAKLLLVGNGALKESLKYYAEYVGLSDEIIWVDQVPAKQVPDYISASDAGLLLFDNNNGKIPGRSIKILEYMACGLPAIVSPTPELADFVTKYQCGVVIDFNKSLESVQKIVTLLDTDLYKDSFGINGRQAVKDNFQWKHTSQKIEELCYSIIEEN